MIPRESLVIIEEWPSSYIGFMTNDNLIQHKATARIGGKGKLHATHAAQVGDKISFITVTGRLH